MKNLEVVKSYKVENSVAVRRNNGKWSVRKIWTLNDGKLAFRIDNIDYTFEWEADNHHTKNIEELREHDSKKGIVAQIKAEMPEIKIPVVAPAVDTDTDVKHEKYTTIKTCVENNIPVYLVGPAGSGKNHTLEQIAEELGLEFHFTNSVQQEFKITGFIDAGGKFHETEFYKAFTNGGLFFLDEMDASIPEVLVLLNAAIANGYFEFPTGKADAHKDFRVVAAGNTFGNGADEQYTGRLTLDQATLDRFTVIPFDYSTKIELFVSKGNAELVTFIHELRKQATEKGIRCTFSYRCITMVTKLEGKLDLTEIMAIAVFKGLDKDTINTFKAEGYSKYHQAMKKVQI
jgi:hypothetical protein